ncbi:hypothetical protein PAXINDRAFT_84644 [Paxillus involutus ATCC 200175]|uniref:Uncharacterized protein n=1 Tax=Paxillus involutus ATCC 200175 TaxID=664439 RepID=A0A0C9TU42_PAXIN|nr:hypothetical protein PAXINDRAFT_90492 [Paxillus involutus ATCC 200175]KIJ11332.1 hypothetical protein PAXINDRAFT_84644 [Paxillus involutus ATCC 200175]
MPNPRIESQDPRLPADTPKVSVSDTDELKAAIKSFTDTMRAMAWSIYRWPIGRRTCTSHARILPVDSRRRRPASPRGHRYQLTHAPTLMDIVGAEKYPGWINYVHTDDVVSR